MAVIIETETPKQLYRLIREAIDANTVHTWVYDSDGDFTHTSEQWGKRAWFRPSFQEGRLVMSVIPPKDRNVTVYVYAVYHSEMVQLLLAHFDGHCSRVTATSMPTLGDIVQPR